MSKQIVFNQDAKTKLLKGVIKLSDAVTCTLGQELPKNQVYVGVQTIIGNSNVMAGPQLTLKTKKDNMYGAGVLIDGNGNKYLGVSVGWKIAFKK
jgi:hypothetical protein